MKSHRDFSLAHFLLMKRNPLFTWFGGLPFKRCLFERKIFFQEIINHENILLFCLLQVEFHGTISSNRTFPEGKTHQDMLEKPCSESILKILLFISRLSRHRLERMNCRENFFFQRFIHGETAFCRRGCGKAGGVVRNFVNKAEINNMKQFCINVFVYLCNFAKQACLNKNG